MTANTLKIPRPKRGRPFLPEKERMVQESFRYPLSTKIKLERFCKKHNIKLTEAIRKAIELYLDENYYAI